MNDFDTIVREAERAEFRRMVHATWTPYEQQSLYRDAQNEAWTGVPDSEFRKLWAASLSMDEEYTLDRLGSGMAEGANSGA